MFFPYKLNKQGENIQPCATNLLTGFQEAGEMVCTPISWIFLSVVIHTVKSFNTVNEAEADVFLEFLCFLYDPTNVSNLISGFSAFSKSSLYIWKFSVHILLKPSLKNFEHNFTSMGNECNCLVVWTLFSTALLGNWDEDWPFPVLWPLLSFPNLLTYWVQHFNSIILELAIAQLEFHHLH